MSMMYPNKKYDEVPDSDLYSVDHSSISEFVVGFTPPTDMTRKIMYHISSEYFREGIVSFHVSLSLHKCTCLYVLGRLSEWLLKCGLCLEKYFFFSVISEPLRVLYMPKHQFPEASRVSSSILHLLSHGNPPCALKAGKRPDPSVLFTILEAHLGESSLLTFIAQKKHGGFNLRFPLYPVHC